MNRNQTDTVLRNQHQAHAETASRRVARFLMKGPSRISPPVATWAVNLLAVGGAAMLVWSAVIHLMLWNDGYKDISVIGPLFLVQGVACIVLALALVLLRWLVLLAAGAVALIATAVGLLLSVHISLFGFQESLTVPYAKLSLGVEFGGAAALAIAAVIAAAARPGRRAGS